MDNDARNQHFKNLLSIAFSDGILDKSELDFLFQKSGKYFITQSELDHLVAHSVNVTPIEVNNSKERAEKITEIIDHTLLMIEDDRSEFIILQTIESLE